MDKNVADEADNKMLQGKPFILRWKKNVWSEIWLGSSNQHLQ